MHMHIHIHIHIKLNQFGNSFFQNKISVFEIAFPKLSSKEINGISSHISEKLINSLSSKANIYQDGAEPHDMFCFLETTTYYRF